MVNYFPADACKNRNGTYQCERPKGHAGLHQMTHNSFGGYEKAGSKRAKWGYPNEGSKTRFFNVKRPASGPSWRKR